MAEFIAVNYIFSVIDFGRLKREALMFDKIVIPNFRKTLEGLHAEHPDKDKLFTEFDWLLEMGIVFEPDIDVTEETLNKDEEYKQFGIGHPIALCCCVSETRFYENPFVGVFRYEANGSVNVGCAFLFQLSGCAEANPASRSWCCAHGSVR